MKRNYTFSQVCMGDIILYENKHNDYCDNKSVKCLVTSAYRCVIIEGTYRGVELPIEDNEIVTLIESLDEYLK